MAAYEVWSLEAWLLVAANIGDAICFTGKYGEACTCNIHMVASARVRLKNLEKLNLTHDVLNFVCMYTECKNSLACSPNRPLGQLSILILMSVYLSVCVFVLPPH